MDRISSGIPGFDELIGGGLPQNRVYLVCGPPGSGKTTFALQFLLEGAFNKEKGIFVSMVEVPENVVEDFSSYGYELKKAIKDGYIRFFDMAPETLLEREPLPPPPGKAISTNRELSSILDKMDKDVVVLSSDLLAKLFNAVMKFQASRLVIDSAMAIRFGSGDEKMQAKELIRFIRGLKDIGCTSVLVSELIQPDAYAPEHFLSHGVIFLHNFLDKGKMKRAVQIVKLRGTAHDTDMHKIEFSKRGMVVSALSGIE